MLKSTKDKKCHGGKKWKMYWLPVARVSSEVESVMPSTKKATPSMCYLAIQHAPKINYAHQKPVYGWNPETEKLPTEATSNINAVIHLAGETIAGRWNAEKKRRIRDSRILSTRNLVASLTDMDVKPDTLVCASAIGYYGGSDSDSLTEGIACRHGFPR